MAISLRNLHHLIPGLLINWDWYSRTTAEDTNVFVLNKRVEAVIAWAHDNLADDEAFVTDATSMGSTTFLTRLWHGLDSIIDYQLLVGGPNTGNCEVWNSGEAVDRLVRHLSEM